MDKIDGRRMNHVPHVLLLAPLIFICHFLEESPGFVGWFNSHVARGITQGLFWRVNFSGLVITLMVVAVEWFSRSAFSLILATAWLGFLMLANAVLHIVGALADGQYVPGLATAILLYLPYYFLLFIRGAQSKRVAAAVLAAAAVLGSVPMLVHGYLIIFRGSRLF
jgi:uncharacterized membrane protein HdeD (DUF308 family)